jgi:thioredoxin reductase (NADPH)
VALNVAQPAASPTETDALVIGAGPVGLFQVFQLGLQGIQAHVVDALPYPGGQCVELYADKPIYDIPGLPVCTGRELTERLLQQIKPFAATFHLGQEVATVEKMAYGRFAVETSRGIKFHSKTLFIAAGVGAFVPRSVKVDGLDFFNHTQLFYNALPPFDLGGKHVLVLGDGESALACANSLAQVGNPLHPQRPASVTLMHRRDSFKASDDTLATHHALRASKQLQFITAQPTGFAEHNGQLTGLQVVDSDAASHLLRADVVLAFLGVSPKLGPVAQWGLDLERKQLKVNTEDFATSEPGIYAVGDINTYPGKKKLILCGFHEATLAAFGAAARLFPEQPIHLQYTTTSPRLHGLLGVVPPTV